MAKDKRYTLSIGGKDTVKITYNDETIERPIGDLFNLFGAVNPFVNMMLPKVMIYSSKMINIDGVRHGFCIVEYNPRAISSEGVEAFVPWTHCLIVYDYDNKCLVDFVLMFSETQLTSEFSHIFHVPKVDSQFLSPSPYLEKLFGITTPVYRIDNYLFLINEAFASCVTALRTQSFYNFFRDSSLDVDLFSDAKEYDAKIASYFSDETVNMGDIDDKILEMNKFRPTFTERITNYYKQQVEK